MYIEDKERFDLHWQYFADHWYDMSKVNEFNQLAIIYSGPRVDICFLYNLRKGLYDQLMSKEAKEFFYDNIDNPLMHEMYPMSSKLTDEDFDLTSEEFRKRKEMLDPETRKFVEKYLEHKEEK